MRACGLLALALALGCATAPSQEDVTAALDERTTYAVNLGRTPDDPPGLPPQIEVIDGLSEEDAAAIALWNSPALRVAFTRLRVAQAELAGAKRPANPLLRFMPATGSMTFYLWFAWALDSFVTMPRRIAVARANADGVATSLVQVGLDLVRDVRVAHADWVLAHERLAVRRTLANLADETVTIARARVEAGDVPPSELDAAQGDRYVAQDEVMRAEQAVLIAEAELLAGLGWRPTHSIAPSVPKPPVIGASEIRDFEAEALTSRPDLLAAQQAIAVAEARVKQQRLAILSVTGVVYSKGGAGQPTGVQAGPEVILPIFDQNQAGVGRAQAELEAAKWQYQVLRDRVVADVSQATLRLKQGATSLDAYRETIVQARTQEQAAAMAQFELGETSYLPVLISANRLANAQLREVELAAELRRSLAELERAVGRRLRPEELDGSTR